MDTKTLAKAFGGKPAEGEATELDESSDTGDSYEGLEAALDIVMDPSSDPETRREAFIRAVKACK